MKVSVIVPTYNREAYICQAIESVLQQTMKDFEIIVVDDGSTDNTEEKIQPYLQNLKYIKTKNGGPAHARNIGMGAATGEYIAFLDSDDLYYPHKLGLQVAVLDKFPEIAMVYTEASAFDDSGYWDEHHLKKYHKNAYVRENINYENIFSENMLLRYAGLDSSNWGNKKIYMGNIFDKYLQHLIVFTPAAMFRRNILKTIGLQNEHYWLSEDFEFMLRISRNYKVAFIDIPTYKLRYHTNQISTSRNKNHIHNTIETQTNLLEIVTKLGLKDREYYLQHKDAIDKRLADLHMALAIPLMAKGKDPKSARIHLGKSAFYGYPEHFLWILTFAPYMIRRLFIKVLSILKKY